MQEDGAPLGLCVSNIEGQSGLNGVFTKDCLVCMLDAADINQLYVLSPFIESLLDSICGESKVCAVTKVFT